MLLASSHKKVMHSEFIKDVINILIRAGTPHIYICNQRTSV